MRANVILFWILAAFFTLVSAIYIFWTIVDEREPGVEWVGLVALSLCAVLSAFIAFYLGRVHRELLPTNTDDIVEAEIVEPRREELR